MSRLAFALPRSTSWLAIAIAALLTQACASGGGGGGSGSGDVITREQIAAMIDRDALAIIQQYQPRWLRPRQQASLSDTNPEPIYATVHLDELPIGDVFTLERIQATQIERIEFYSAIDATTRFGMGYVGGLIVVRTIGRAN